MELSAKLTEEVIKSKQMHKYITGGIYMKNDNQAFEQLLKTHGGKINREALEKAKKSGDTSALVNSLSDSDKQKLNQLLSDKEQLAKVLKSPQAQMLLKMFGGKNG